MQSYDPTLTPNRHPHASYSTNDIDFQMHKCIFFSENHIFDGIPYS